MPRPNKGPRLELYGPDDKYGARSRKGFKRYLWYIVWSEGGRKREYPTGAGDRGEAERVLARWIEDRAAAQPARTGPRHPDQMTMAEVLAIYGEQHAPHTAGAGAATIGYNIKALAPWWGESPVTAVTAAACRRYAKERKRAAGTTHRELGTLCRRLCGTAWQRVICRRHRRSGCRRRDRRVNGG